MSQVECLAADLGLFLDWLNWVGRGEVPSITQARDANKAACLFSTLSLSVVRKPSEDALSDLDHPRINPGPAHRENFARLAPTKHRQEKSDPFSQIRDSRRQRNFSWSSVRLGPGRRLFRWIERTCGIP